MSGKEKILAALAVLLVVGGVAFMWWRRRQSGELVPSMPTSAPTGITREIGSAIVAAAGSAGQSTAPPLSVWGSGSRETWAAKPPTPTPEATPVSPGPVPTTTPMRTAKAASFVSGSTGDPLRAKR